MLKIEYRWKVFAYLGSLIEPTIYSDEFRVLTNQGFETEEEAVAAYKKVIHTAEWDSPGEMVLLKVYVRDFDYLLDKS